MFYFVRKKPIASILTGHRAEICAMRGNGKTFVEIAEYLATTYQIETAPGKVRNFFTSNIINSDYKMPEASILSAHRTEIFAMRQNQKTFVEIADYLLLNYQLSTTPRKIRNFFLARVQNPDYKDASPNEPQFDAH